ncbi:MAG: low-complexity tail membrane protein [Symploca sp. SIO3C6]|uniref:Low-complexity tail membrane protein n=1 Tax=Symploca sp. SIO1C4 TaxID=2607765 RepID=A0A6B3N659_9CYAN|nr:low-complexity tail membrane protein [Symploca sp. SIO3C6]NER27057.1 low-complexity tail membrane protein [Symploca sp. SIO1C4]NET06947.1 low-complexity tail membrane protein [Symploca sp. SIO2B6]
MRSFWKEPLLWIHLAGLAALPLALEVVWLGLAIGDPIVPVPMELMLVAAIGVLPVLWMQLTRPFDIFSILVIAIKPEKLTQEQRSILSLFKTKANPVLTIAAGVLMLWVLWQIYRVAPLAATVTHLAPGWRLVGLLGAGLAFGVSNLFLQVPLSVGQVLFTSESAFAATEPYPLEQIRQDFTIPGLQVNQILPFTELESANATTLEEVEVISNK